MYPSTNCADASTYSLKLVSPLPPSFLNIWYYLLGVKPGALFTVSLFFVPFNWVPPFSILGMVQSVLQVLCFDLRPRPKKCYSKVMHGKGSDTFQWPVIERDRVANQGLIIWDKGNVPLCQYRLMNRKRVTCELHDSYFRLMTIKHSISKIQRAIVWALNYYLTQLSSSPRSSWQLPVEFQTARDQMW